MSKKNFCLRCSSKIGHREGCGGDGRGAPTPGPSATILSPIFRFLYLFYQSRGAKNNNQREATFFHALINKGFGGGGGRGEASILKMKAHHRPPPFAGFRSKMLANRWEEKRCEGKTGTEMHSSGREKQTEN